MLRRWARRPSSSSDWPCSSSSPSSSTSSSGSGGDIDGHRDAPHRWCNRCCLRRKCLLPVAKQRGCEAARGGRSEDDRRTTGSGKEGDDGATDTRNGGYRPFSVDHLSFVCSTEGVSSSFLTSPGPRFSRASDG